MTFLKPGANSPAATHGVSRVVPIDPLDRARAVRHAISDLRAGTPCLLAPRFGLTLAILAAETASAAGLADFSRVTLDQVARLLLPAGRISDRAAAVVLEPSQLDPAALRGLADPTAPQPIDLNGLRGIDAPHGMLAAIELAKRARLLPTVLAAVVPDEADRGSRTLVSEEDVSEPTESGEVDRVASAIVPLAAASNTRVVAFRGAHDDAEHFAVLIGTPERSPDPLLRVHSECFTGDLLGSLRCDCGVQLRGAIERMAAEGAGILLYLAQEGRGIGLVNKLRAYALQDRGLDTLDANHALGWGADERDYALAASMLRSLGLARARLLTNNPRKIEALATHGIEVTRVSHLFASNGVNEEYIATKVRRFGHLAK